MYSLPKLLQELAPLPSIYVAEAWLEHGDKHAHVSGLGCALHSSLRAAAHCSLSISQRMVFSVAHCCCQAYKIQPRFQTSKCKPLFISVFQSRFSLQAGTALPS